VSDIAHIPDSNLLDIISYSLRGDAHQWYKNFCKTHLLHGKILNLNLKELTLYLVTKNSHLKN
jgi:hypothetical protein